MRWTLALVAVSVVAIPLVAWRTALATTGEGRGETYEAFLVGVSVALGLILFVATVLLVWRFPALWWVTTIADTVVMTVVWSTLASQDPFVIGANMWPIGATFLAVGTAVVALLVSLSTAGTRRAHDGRTQPSGRRR